LVENQAIEAEEQERALAEARGESSRGRRVYDDVDHDEEDVSRVRVVGEGDASGDEDVEGDADKVVDVSLFFRYQRYELTSFQKTRRPDKEPVYDPDLQIKLELAYLTNPAIFDRDAATRRSDGRIKLRDRTGMDDGQLEGWRVMLERNVRLVWSLS
jgi:activating signal cointegrator complex subunit 2